ncbi:MAG: SDR family NAD(P)-dependent oxidoreductase [Bacteroidia bacterium]|nr:SDR family NAD(P)-dependent oxidoreductase [Bacteroidia bacterium]
MNILITGGAGFIGSHLADTLIEKGHNIKSLDNLITGRLSNLDHLQENPHFEFVNGDVTDMAVMEPLVAWCDHCYHLAAPVGVKYVMDNPVRTILDNVRGIDTVLFLVHKYNKRVLVASTSEVYGRSLDLLDKTGVAKLQESDYRVEGSTRNHRWAYANTKAMDEFLSFAYHKEYGTEIVIARFFNTVGPRQLFDYGMVIPNFVSKAIAGENVEIFGTGEQKRSFMHVKDAVRAVTGLMLTGKGVGEEFNVGNPIEITMNDLAQKVLDKVGGPSKIIHRAYADVYGPGYEDMNRRTADITKLMTTLDFELEYKLEDILDDVIAYFHQKASANA